MNFKRFLAVCCAAVLLASLPSCGFIVVNDLSGRSAGSEGTDNADGAAVTEVSSTGYVKMPGRADAKAKAESYLASLPERDYEGTVFFIATPDRGYIAPEDTESVVSRLAVQRNAEVEERLNVTLLADVHDGAGMVEELNQAIASGTFFADLLLVPFYRVGSFKATSTLLNMRTAPFFDLDQPYFDRESSEASSGGYATYAVGGDATLSPSVFSGVYFNRKILEDAGVDTRALYRSVPAGSWTWDRLLSVTEAVASREDCMTITADSLAERFPDLVFKSMGNNFVQTGLRKVPVVGYTAHKAEDTMNVLERLYGQEKAGLEDLEDAVTAFAEGKSAFHVEYLYAMSWLTNAKTDWGLLPLPKASEGDGAYRTLVANDAQVFCIPKNHTNAEIPAVVLSALCAASDGYIYDAYVDYHMMNVVRDNDTVNMLDLILDSACFDFAVAFGNAFPSIADATYRLVRKCAPTNNLSDEYSALRTEANAVMKQNFDLTY